MNLRYLGDAMFSRKFYYIIAILIVFTIVLGSCAPPPDTPADPDDEMISVSLRLAWIANAQAAGSYVALDKGFFAEEGLDVQINPGGPDANSITLVAAGTNTFGFHDTNSLVQAEVEGLPLVTFATFWERHPGCVFTIEGTGITELEDFVGKRIGFKEGGPWTLTKAMLRANGIDPGSMEQISVGFGIAPIMDGQVDLLTAFCTNEPLAVAREGETPITFLPADYGIETSTEALFTTRSFHEANPGVACRMVRAISRGWEYAIENKEEAIQIVLDYGGEELDFDLQMQQLIAQEDFIITAEAQEHGIGHMTHERWQIAHDTLLQEGELAESIDISNIYDMSCWE